MHASWQRAISTTMRYLRTRVSAAELKRGIKYVFAAGLAASHVSLLLLISVPHKPSTAQCTLRFPTPPANGACTHMCVHAKEANPAASSTSSPCHAGCLHRTFLPVLSYHTALRYRPAFSKARLLIIAVGRIQHSTLCSHQNCRARRSFSFAQCSAPLQSVCLTLSFTSRCSSVTLVFSSLCHMRIAGSCVELPAVWT